MLRLSAGKLFLKFLAYMAPVFLALAALGLHGVTRYAVRGESDLLAARVGNHGARMAAALGRFDAGRLADAGPDLMGSLMADPAIGCAEYRAAEKSAPDLAVPALAGCAGQGGGLIKLDIAGDAPGQLLTIYYSSEEVDSAARNYLILGGLVGLAGLLAALIAGGIGFQRTIGAPLSRLRRGIQERAGSGRTSVVASAARDELGDVISAFNALQLQIEEAAGKLESEAALRAIEQQKAAQARWMTESIGRFREAILLIKDSLSCCVTQASEASGKLDSNASGLRFNAACVEGESRQSADSAKLVDEASLQLAANSSEIVKQAQALTGAKNDILEVGAVVGARVKELASAASKITELSQLIASVATQTNLLGLNATIEAARAGPAGRGFAVVAAEVKNLAAGAARAATEISGFAQNIEAGIGGSLEAARRLASVSAAIDQSSTHIAEALGAQNRSISEISRVAEASKSSTDMVASSFKQMTDTVVGTGKTATEVGDVARSIAAVNESLRTAVDRLLADIAA